MRPPGDTINLYGARVLFPELGVGGNTPGIIKYPFIQKTGQNANAVYACLNLGEAMTARKIAGHSIVIDADIAEVLKQIAN